MCSYHIIPLAPPSETIRGVFKKSVSLRKVPNWVKYRQSDSLSTIGIPLPPDYTEVKEKGAEVKFWTNRVHPGSGAQLPLCQAVCLLTALMLPLTFGPLRLVFWAVILFWSVYHLTAFPGPPSAPLSSSVWRHQQQKMNDSSFKLH